MFWTQLCLIEFISKIGTEYKQHWFIIIIIIILYQTYTIILVVFIKSTFHVPKEDYGLPIKIII